MPKKIICIGAALIDEIYTTKDIPQSGTSNPATREISAGGVARNIAQHLAQLRNQVDLITHFGNDDAGKFLMEQCRNLNIGISHSKINEAATGHFTAILSPDGNLFAAASATIFDEELDVNFLNTKKLI